MPHRDAAERAEWLRMLARDLPALSETSTLAVRETADTLREIAAYLDETEPGRLPPDTLWVTFYGPALYYFNNEDATLTSVRLDKPPTGVDPLASDDRERGLCASLVRLVHNRINAAEHAG